MSSESEVLEAYSKPRAQKDKLLETKFLHYAKTIGNKRGTNSHEDSKALFHSQGETQI